jgi:hypothetical protein
MYQIGIVLYQLLGGYLPYNALDWLSKLEMKAYLKITDAFEKSVFIDKVLCSRAKKRYLVDLNKMPIFVSDGLKKVIKTATHPDHLKRFQNVTQFLLALHKVGDSPDWRIDEGVTILIDFRGRDYRIIKKGNKHICEQKKTGATQWRKDGSISEGNEKEVIEALVYKNT